MSRAQGVLLDLDGTLLDTAPDMTHALNALRAEHALPALALADIRPHVSHGSNAVVRAGFPEAIQHDSDLRAVDRGTRRLSRGRRR